MELVILLPSGPCADWKRASAFGALAQPHSTAAAGLALPLAVTARFRQHFCRQAMVTTRDGIAAFCMVFSLPVQPATSGLSSDPTASTWLLLATAGNQQRPC